MIIRTFLLSESFDKSDGFVIKKPFSIVSFDDFPTNKFKYYIYLSLEDYDENKYKIDLKMLDPNGNITAKWSAHEFKGSPNKEARGIIYRHPEMVFKIPGVYKYQIFADDETLGEYTLVVLNKKGR